jgi:diaminopimelate epimerase
MKFTKYQGTGNDFIIIDNRDHAFTQTSKIPQLCDRKFGIGSDGLILIQNHTEADFEMIFHNPDGSMSFCGNGARCAVAFARQIGLVTDSCSFAAIDGIHLATLTKDLITVKMADCTIPEKMDEGMFIHTGSPHYILESNDVNALDIRALGPKYRHRTDLFGAGGTNVNFIEELEKGSVFVRTFERGVEEETLSCGTGVTGAAICYGLKNDIHTIAIVTKGGELTVQFEEKDHLISDIFLTGPAVNVFEGSIRL